MYNSNKNHSLIGLNNILQQSHELVRIGSNPLLIVRSIGFRLVLPVPLIRQFHNLKGEGGRFWCLFGGLFAGGFGGVWGVVGPVVVAQGEGVALLVVLLLWGFLWGLLLVWWLLGGGRLLLLFVLRRKCFLELYLATYLISQSLLISYEHDLTLLLWQQLPLLSARCCWSWPRDRPPSATHWSFPSTASQHRSNWSVDVPRCRRCSSGICPRRLFTCSKKLTYVATLGGSIFWGRCSGGS